METPFDNPGVVEPAVPSPISAEERAQPLPAAQPQASTNDSAVFVISRVMFNYFIIAAVFAILGGFVGHQMALTNSGEMRKLVEQAVNSALDARGLTAENQAVRAVIGQHYEVSADDDPALGPDDAPVTIIEFSDYKCPYCGRFQRETFSNLMADYEGKIRFVYRDFPILGEQSLLAALASECADDQGKYWPYHDLMFANQQDLSRDALVTLAQQTGLNLDDFTSCLDSQTHMQEIVADYNAAQTLGLTGTPGFFINGRFLSGAQPYAAFAQYIDEALAAGAESTPEASAAS